MANTLFLRLEGPLQSWGERGRWAVRDTAPEPTKSGVVGLLGCALGLREDEELRQLSSAVQVGVRCDRPGSLLVDYHTIVGGVMSAEGRVKFSHGQPETVVSWRHYLSDASFLVAVRADAQVIERLAEAVQAPHWPIYLGRKSCPPVRPIYDGVGDFATMLEALAARPAQGAEGPTVSVRAVVDCPPGEGALRRDELLSRSRRAFGPRYVRDVSLKVPIIQGEKEG